MEKKDFLRICGITAIIAVAFFPPFSKYQELRSKNVFLDREIQKLREDNRRLEDEKRRLETDISYIEKKARQKIGVVRKGEIVIKKVP